MVSQKKIDKIAKKTQTFLNKAFDNAEIKEVYQGGGSRVYVRFMVTLPCEHKDEYFNDTTWRCVLCGRQTPRVV